MNYLVFVLAGILFFVVIHKMTELQLQAKIATAVFMALVVIGFYAYEKENTEKAKQERALVYEFSQGKVLDCDGVTVENKNFNYVSHSFIGKKGTPMYGTPNISITQCKIKP